MGKKSRIKSLAKITANIVMHKILVKYTNKPESIHFLNSEIIEYRHVAVNISEEYNWNSQDIENIKSNAIKLLTIGMNKKYPDVKFPISEAENLVEETLKEMMF